jgi:carboxypeptidase Taq
MMAAQLWAALEKAQGSVREDMKNGRFVGLNDWRRQHVWSQASLWPTPELLKRATDEPLKARYFIKHLQQRYLA